MALGGDLGDWCVLELMDSLKGAAPMNTTINGGMVQAPDGSLVVMMEEASEFSIADLDDAVADFVDTYEGVVNIAKTVLPDGYVFTCQNEPEIGGTNFWMQARREINGKTYSIQATAATLEQQQNAAKFAKSIHE